MKEADEWIDMIFHFVNLEQGTHNKTLFIIFAFRIKEPPAVYFEEGIMLGHDNAIYL
jgi:hypothetical protein